MSTTTAINGIYVPTLTDAPNINASIQPMAEDIDTLLVPRFATLAARNAAITSPANGMLCWVDETGELYLRNTTWISAKPRFIMKTSPENRTNSTYANDAQLSISVEANSVYLVRMLILITGTSGTGDFKMDFVIPAGAGPGPSGTAAQGGGFYTYNTSDLLTLGDLNTTTGMFAGTAASVWRPIFAETVFATAGTAGTLQLQWAQGTTSGTTTVGEGSYLEVWKTT